MKCGINTPEDEPTMTADIRATILRTSIDALFAAVLAKRFRGVVFIESIVFSGGECHLNDEA